MTQFRGRAGGNRGPVDRWLEITRDDSGRVTVMILSARTVSLGAMRMTSLDARAGRCRVARRCHHERPADDRAPGGPEGHHGRADGRAGRGRQFRRKAMIMNLTPEQVGELQNALDDAIEYWGPDNGSCHDCTPQRMCADHQGDKEAADSYRDLRGRLADLLGQREIEAA